MKPNRAEHAPEAGVAITHGYPGRQSAPEGSPSSRAAGKQAAVPAYPPSDAQLAGICAALLWLRIGLMLALDATRRFFKCARGGSK